jgi:hypothetical protein
VPALRKELQYTINTVSRRRVLRFMLGTASMGLEGFHLSPEHNLLAMILYILDFTNSVLQELFLQRL